MSNDLEKLELKIAFLERASNDLSDVVYRQQRELDQLRARIAELAQRIEAQKEAPTAYTPEQERPPHY